jgi:predicted nuclease of predicted toxin-antitoxin system
LKILLDHNLDRRLKQSLTDYETTTTQEHGWADLLNGDLLAYAEAEGFNVMLTADSNLKNQQNISGRNIAVLVLRAPTIAWQLTSK